MGDNVKQAFETVCTKAKKFGRWCWDRRGYAVAAGEMFLIEYGALTLAFDLTGLTGKLIDSRVQKASISHYNMGFSDGVNTATKVLRAANGVPLDTKSTSK